MICTMYSSWEWPEGRRKLILFSVRWDRFARVWEKEIMRKVLCVGSRNRMDSNCLGTSVVDEEKVTCVCVGGGGGGALNLFVCV